MVAPPGPSCTLAGRHAARRVVLGGEDDLMCAAMQVSHVRLIGRSGGDSMKASVRVRHRHEGADAMVTLGAGARAHVAFDRPVRGVSPGQAAVFYDGDRVLGGGWIDGAL